MIVFSEKNIIKTTLAEVNSRGFKCQHYGTVIECYKKDDKKIYWHNDKKVFFKNAVPDIVEKPTILKLIVAGGGDFNDRDLLFKTLDHILRSRTTKDVIIVCGEARGADTLGEEYAVSKGYKVKYFPADWDEFGRSAGFKRNEEMAKYSNACVVFWDGRSKGSKHMIDLAEQYNLRLKVVMF